MAADPFQVEHDAREFRGCDFGAFTGLTRLKVLAKHAAQIAPAEKDGARAIPAAQTIFLAEVRKGAGHARETATLAYADLVVKAINRAITLANATRLQ